MSNAHVTRTKLAVQEVDGAGRNCAKASRALSLLGQLEFLGQHSLAFLVLVSRPGFREGDTARSLLRQQFPHSFPRHDQKQEYDESLKAVQQVRRYPGEIESRPRSIVLIEL